MKAKSNKQKHALKDASRKTEAFFSDSTTKIYFF